MKGKNLIGFLLSVSLFLTSNTGVSCLYNNQTVKCNAALTKKEPKYEEHEGVCGDNLTWKLDVNGVLTISGKGEMYDFLCPSAIIDNPKGLSKAPWYDYGNQIKKVIVEEGVLDIGRGAFVSESYDRCDNYLSLESVTLPDGILQIGTMSFMGCQNLKSINLPDSIEAINEAALGICKSLSEIHIPSGIKVISKNAFMNCGLKAVEIPENVQVIEDGAFWYNQSLESVSIHKGVLNIGDRAFGSCKSLNSLIIPEGVENISDHAFESSGLKEVTLPRSVTSIGNDAFSYNESLIIKCYSNSYSETFANKRRIDYILIDNTVYPGDLTGDDHVDITDLSKLAILLVDKTILTEKQKKAGDVTRDGEVNLSDLARFRQYLSKQIENIVDDN